MYTTARSILTCLAVLAGLLPSTAQTYNWSSAGPVYTSGRARAMVVDRNNSNVLYVGSASGGVFRSENGGSTWRPLNDKSGNVRNISYITQAINGTIYASTGEGFLRIGQKARAQAGTGLYKLVDTILTQVADASITGTVINRIACSPTNADHIALATNLGILVSTDGGASFNKASHTPSAVPNSSYGMDVKFDSNGKLYCSVGNERGGTAALDAIQSRVFKSDSDPLTLTQITPTNSAFSPTVYGRIELAIAPSNPNVIYASCAKKNRSTTSNPQPGTPSLAGLFVSTDAGANWELITQGAAQLDPLTNGGSIASGDYAHVLTVNPGDPHMLFIGGYNAYVFDASPSNPAVGIWIKIGNHFAINTPLYLHENIHDIKIMPGNPSKFYFITDAGIYRSTDLISTSQQLPPSFQAIYRGLVTGQFNSVSPERYPVLREPLDAIGKEAKPIYGYIGGTGGNGVVYYSGTGDLVSQEEAYVGGEVYNAEFSKLLPDAAIFSTGEGKLYRSTNIRTSPPTIMNINNYSGSLSVVAPAPAAFENSQVTTGTSFRLWENYGQVIPPPDSAFFFNDTIREVASMSGLSTLTSQRSFTLRPARPSKFARIDSIAIRTGTVQLPSDPANIPTPYSTADKRDIRINVTDAVVPETTISVSGQNGTEIHKVRVYSASNLTITGPADTVNPARVMENETSLFDEIVVTFSAAPFASKTQTYSNIPDPALYYRVFATVFYRYDPGDTVYVQDDNITTRETRRFAVLTDTLRWAYGTEAPNTASLMTAGYIRHSPHNRPVGIPVGNSARLAMHLSHASTANQPAIAVAKAPLNLNDPLNIIRVSQSGCYTDDANGAPTYSLIFYTGRPYLVEWSKSGTEIYFATSDNKLYRVSHINRLMDLSSASYSGKLLTDVYSYFTAVNTATPNPNTPYRTTHIGTFNRPISSLSTSNDGSKLLVTFAAGSSTAPTVMMNTVDVRKANITNQVWVSKSDNVTDLAGKATYCSMMEKDNDAKVFVGTDNGIMYTSDIYAASPVWENINNNELPNVQVFDIEQQVLTPADAYNSGEIYVATNGRGVWSSRSLFKPYVVSVQEEEPIRVTEENNLTMFPNPTAGKLTVAFGSVSGEHAVAQLMDMSGRVVHTEDLGKLSGEDYTHTLDVNHLGAGIYIVNISSDSGVQRVSKLVIAK